MAKAEIRTLQKMRKTPEGTPNLNQSWVRGFEEAMCSAIVDCGSIVSDSGFFGWKTHKATEHLRDCGVGAIHGEIEEDTWYGSEDTFDDSEAPHYGMKVTVSCCCGEITERRVRWEATFGEALRQILKAAGAMEGLIEAI